MRTAALIAEPAGDADVVIAVQIREQFVARAGEAMHHRRTQAPLEAAHDGDEILVRIALVQEQRLAVVGRQLQLAFEGLALRRARRKIAK